MYFLWGSIYLFRVSFPLFNWLVGSFAVEGCKFYVLEIRPLLVASFETVFCPII